MTSAPLKLASLFTVVLGLVACQSPWISPMLAWGSTDSQTLEVAEVETIRVTATVPAQALPRQLKAGWRGAAAFNFDGWVERDDVRINLFDCDEVGYGTADSQLDSYEGGLVLGADVFNDCLPDEDCVRELCVDIEVLTARTVEINWDVYAELYDKASYHMYNREGKRQLAEHPVQGDIEIQLDFEVL